MGAYVVDGGSYGIYAGDCVASGGVYNDISACTHGTARQGTTATVGSKGAIFGTYL